MRNSNVSHIGVGLSGFHFALSYAEKHLPSERYQQIRAAYNRFIGGTVAMAITLAIVSLFVVFGAISTGVSSTTDPCAGFPGADSCKIGSVDFDDNVRYTYDSQTYKAPLIEYGLDPEDFEPNDQLMVYFDANHNLIGVAEKGGASAGIPPFFVFAAGMAVALMVVVTIFVAIAKQTFAKDFFDYYKQYQNGELA